jgi:prepilin-type N-terminal cleavage/methylation domain-containing protein
VRAHGYTLLEFLIAVAVVGLVAATAIPQLAAPDLQRLDLAAREMANALQYARSEALRTGQPLGVNASTTQNRLRVFRYDLSQPTPVEDYSVYHPVEKKYYDISFASAPFTSGISITKAEYWSVLTKFTGSVLFGPNGTPILVSGSTVKPYTYGGIEICLGTRKKTVSIEPETGRITIN